MLFFRDLSLSAILFSIVVLGSPSVIPRAPDDTEPLNISNPPTRGAVCPTETVPAAEITAALEQGNKWVQEGVKMGDHNSYPREFHVNPGEVFSGTEYEGMTLYEYPILLGGRQNPWVPGPRTKIPGKSAVRVIFVSTSKTEAIFCGVVAKDENRAYQLCPI